MSTTELTLAEGVGAVAAATAAGSFYTGAPFMDVVTSVSGGLGAGLGYLAGRAVASQMKDLPGAAYMPLAGAIVVPGVAGGRWDVAVLLMGGAAYAGAMVLDKMFGSKAQ